MNFTTQLIQLLSEPPGSFLYHLLVLFALQIVFAISYGRVRRNPGDELARRMSWAAGAIFAGQCLLLIYTFFLRDDPQRAALNLPPLENAIATAGLAFLVWSFLPRPRKGPRTTDIILIVILLLTGALYLFSRQAWLANAATGAVSYAASTQATIWSLLQIAILTAGLAYLLLKERSAGALPTAVLATLLIAHIMTLWNYPEFVPTTTSVAYWNRLGNLIALPLWAVFAYQQALVPLLVTETKVQGAGDQVGRSLHEAAQLIATRQTPRRIALGLDMAQDMLQGAFAAIAFIDPADPDTLVFRSNLPSSEESTLKEWRMSLNDNQALRTAVGQERPVELQSEGLGARQLHAIYQAAGLAPQGPLLILPLAPAGQHPGLLLVAGEADRSLWPAPEQQLAGGLAAFLAQALANSQAQVITPPSGPSPESPSPLPVVPAAIVMDRARLRDLERERDDLRDALAQANAARRLVENSALAAQKQARYLAAALRVAQAPGSDATDVNQGAAEAIRDESDE
jgi:hypothetical protein